LSFSERLQEIRTGFERPFWVANISELFERLSYYAVFAVLARYLHEGLHFDVERASSLTGMFGGWVWFLAIGGGALCRSPRFSAGAFNRLSDPELRFISSWARWAPLGSHPCATACRW